MMDHSIASQKQLELVRSIRGELRNFHTGIDWVGYWDVFCVLMDVAASGVNATLIAKGHPKYQHRSSFNATVPPGEHPSALPEVWLFDKYDKSLDRIWSSYCNSTVMKSGTNLPEIFMKETMQHNFVYCGARKIKWDSNWNFHFLLNPFM